MTCIYFSVSLKGSGHEFKILGESYVSVFLICPQSLSQNYRTGHIANQDLVTPTYTGRIGHAYARPSRTAESSRPSRNLFF